MEQLVCIYCCSLSHADVIAGYLYAMAFALLGFGRAVGLARSQVIALRTGIKVVFHPADSDCRFVRLLSLFSCERENLTYLVLFCISAVRRRASV